ncbi:MarR family regulator [Frankia torreyi]|uniref:MarR family regulator n=1 Tax=Frankia torreyi TaxID=1856 RepID=A0A0D8BJA9_9ACTN|nr:MULTISPECIES: MarR family transcriptional regulator [Frankia]KJE23492.1 MarR family regulator [Frankia torreyi]KQM05506.1 MarR family regulator [Frankia sp. CpI1-P]
MKCHRRRLDVSIKELLRELGIQSSVLNDHVGTHPERKDIDLDCLDLADRFGPLSPNALARRVGLHPATMTGILDRLERSGWPTPDPTQLDATRLDSAR